MPVQKLFDEARRCGIRKLVLTEINNVSSWIELQRICLEHQPDPVSGLNRFGAPGYLLEIGVGVEFRRENEPGFIMIARNAKGFERINRYLSHLNAEHKLLPRRAPVMEDVWVIYPFGRLEPEEMDDHEWLGVRWTDTQQLSFQRNYQSFSHRAVVLQPVTFSGKSDFNVHRLLRAIDANTLLSKLQPDQVASTDEIMMSENEFSKRFERWPELMENTRKILDNCSLEIPLGTDKNLQSISGSVEEDWDRLTQSAWEGFRKLYDADDPVLCERLERELRIIREKGFGAYYLITYDMVQFANQHGYAYVGRGSGANSVVAYCLGITNVDPIELDLYFERFLNSERTSPPDFDIDFSWDNRDAIYDYLFGRYGKDRVCLLGTHVTYQARSVIRELGKVFGLPKEEIDALVEDPERNRHRDHIAELIFTYAQRIKDLPANISIHAGGVLITDQPIYAYTATEMPPKGYPVAQFEMHNAEDLGIFKFDILSQRGLGHLKETVRHVHRNKGVVVDINRFRDFKQDPRVRELLRTSRAMGCFYVESPAMRMLLGKLRCEDYLTLVAASSIIRPGVARSGMMRAYIERFHAVRNGKTYESIHPRMDELMKETYGVMVYQEDVIKVAHHFAGLTLTEADVLRRGMSGKYRSRREFERVRERFFTNCLARGIEQKVVDRVWFEIESFSGYSFAKGHSASYAVESYQSLYLKAHYPLEFMVGVINNFGGFYRTEFYFHEARMSGASIEAPCVNHSDYLTTITGNSIYIGFIHLKSLETGLARQIEIERMKHGGYRSLPDFLARTRCGLEQIRILIRCGSFRFTGQSKQKLLWEAMLFFSDQRARKEITVPLFNTEPSTYPLPPLERNDWEDAFDEIELLGFPLCDPFRLLATRERGDTMADELPSKLGRQVSMIGYIVTTKNTSTLKGEPMYFGTFYDEKGQVFDTVHFPQIAWKFPFRGRGFYSMRGKVVEDFGVCMVEVNWMEKQPMIRNIAMEELGSME
ncbi:MAG: DNA polymerase III subunit alpha [Cyclobacteriaceae bacterium]